VADLRCKEYGFGCNYIPKGNPEKIVFDFWEHMTNEHGINHFKETIMESVKRNNSKASPKSVKI
jgi:predicted small metal-binding protein